MNYIVTYFSSLSPLPPTPPPPPQKKELIMAVLAAGWDYYMLENLQGQMIVNTYW